MAYATALLTQRWPNGRIPYRIAPPLRRSAAEAEVRAAIETWRRQTHRHFDDRPRRGEPCLVFTDDYDRVRARHTRPEHLRPARSGARRGGGRRSGQHQHPTRATRMKEAE